MKRILDDEFIIQMDDSPPFSWLRETPNRLINCDTGRRLENINVHATGNALVTSNIVRDISGKDRVHTDGIFSLVNDGVDVIVSYSGELKQAITLLESSDRKGIAISSGGMIKSIARSKGWDYISLPKGYPARFLFPEIFGCFLSLLGVRIRPGTVEDFIQSISPSRISEENVAKRIAYAIENKSLTIRFDDRTVGLAARYRDSFRSNAQTVCSLIEIGQTKTHEGRDSYVISLASEPGNSEESEKEFHLFNSGSIDGCVKNALLADYASIYLGILKGYDIELVDKIRE